VGREEELNMTPILEIEGTWDEIALHAREFEGRRLKVSVFPLTQAESTAQRLRILSDIAQRSEAMNPSADERDLLREGRAGAMFGG
jgi:hypothetical protein